jgi:hypothetical protein
MDHLHKSLIAALVAAFFSLPAFAGYAEAVPPSGWSSGEGVGGKYQRPANSPSWNTGSATANVTTNVGGRTVTMNASMRMAANAGKFIAGRMFNPWWVAAGIAIPLAMQWFDSQGGFKFLDGQWHKVNTGAGLCYTAPCYSYYGVNQVQYYDPTPTGACHKWIAIYNTANANGTHFQRYNGNTETACFWQFVRKSDGAVISNNSQQIAKTSRTPDQVAYTPATQQEMEDKMGTLPVPDNVANELPLPMPVQSPSINPGPAPDNLPTTWRVPTGEPRPMPGTDPLTYRQPVVDVVPSPTPDSPWRVDLQPKDVTSQSPTGQPSPGPVPGGDPAANQVPKEDKPVDLCAEHPEILACQKLDEPSSEELPTRSPSISITPDTGWGADNASCPLARHVIVNGRDIPIPFDLVCTFMSGIRPVLITVAWLIAAMLVVGAVRSND